MRTLLPLEKFLKSLIEKRKKYKDEGTTKHPLFLFVLIIFMLGTLFSFQNCSDVNLTSLSIEKASLCDPSLYNVSRENKVSGYMTYFIQVNKLGAPQQFESDVTWSVTDASAGTTIPWEPSQNRVLVDCADHPQQIELVAQFQNDCGTTLNITETFDHPGSCDVPDPVEPPHAPGGTLQDVQNITAGGRHTCVILSNGTSTCWGNNYEGQFGNGESGYESASPILFSNGISDAKEVISGDNYACAILNNGKIKCWGQLIDHDGTNPPEIIKSPREVAGLSDVTKLSIAHNRACALSGSGASSKLYCWGFKFGNYFPLQSTPTEISPANGYTDPINGAKQIAGNLLLLKENKTYALNTYVLNTKLKLLDFGSLLGSIEKIYARDARSSTKFCATNNNTIKCGGYSISAGGNDSTPDPRDIKTMTLDTLDIAVGENHTCALLPNKTVKCWGKNDLGQLGNGGNGSESDIPVLVENLSNVKSIAAGRNHTCALLLDQTVMCWGENTKGQLGSGDFKSYDVPVQVVAQTEVPTRPPFPDNFCKQYLTSLSNKEFEHFKNYYVGTDSIEDGNGRIVEAISPRKLSRIDKSYEDVSCGIVDRPVILFPENVRFDGKILPKCYDQNGQQRTFRNSLPGRYTGANGDNYLSLLMKLKEGESFSTETSTAFNNYGGLTSSVNSYSFSPCQGDFRPKDISSNDPFLSQCRQYKDADHMSVSSKTSLERCHVPAGKTFYLNISRSNLMNSTPENVEIKNCDIFNLNAPGLEAWDCGQSLQMNWYKE